ncbi:hypothetical protein RJ639_019862 [Escallonia herrerae]|uniref:Uncharacterized protein n=1 Tax=Escallonia herrerae TaxID=1293975 RepID=A0AA89AIG4_9ASTE|nr:hypothetical protein RJ639_019862 [Escallonia herrerae]
MASRGNCNEARMDQGVRGGGWADCNSKTKSAVIIQLVTADGRSRPRLLQEDAPDLGDNPDRQTVATMDVWKHLYFLCKNYILIGLDNALYNVYSRMVNAKALWESLERKYKMKDASSKKFVVGKFLDFKIVDSKTVISQVQEFQLNLHDFHAEGMVLRESFQVVALIEKLPPTWKDFKNYLKHKRKEMKLEDLIVRLRIEEDSRQSKKKAGNYHQEAKANVVEQGPSKRRKISESDGPSGASGSNSKGGDKKMKFNGNRYLFCSRHIRLGLGQALDDAAEWGGVGNVVLVPQRLIRRQHADVELLSEVVPLCHRRPQVPHAGVVQCGHDGRPRVGVHLDGVPAHDIKEVVVLPLLGAPPSGFNCHWEEGVAIQVPCLDGLLVVLEYDLHKVAEGGVQHVGGKHHLAVLGRGLVAHQVLHRGCGVDVGHAVDGKFELAIDLGPGVDELDGAGDVDLPVVVGTLWVGACSACGQVPPEGAVLVDGPHDAFGVIGWRCWELWSCGALAVGVADDGHGAEGLLHEPGRGHHVVVLGFLVGGDEHGGALRDVDVQGVVHILHGVGTLDLDELHSVALDPEVEGGPHSNITNPVPVGLAGLHGEEGLVNLSDLAVLAVDENAVGPADGAAGFEQLLEGLVALGVPVANHNGVVVSGIGEWNWYEKPAVDAEATKGTGGLVYRGGGIVEIAADLVLDLEVVGVVGTGKDGAHGSEGTILPAVLAVLDAVPGEEERLVEVVEDVDDDVVVAGAVDVGTRELAVDEDGLLRDAQRGDGAVGDVPLKEEVRVLGTNHHGCGGEAQQQRHERQASHGVAPPFN